MLHSLSSAASSREIWWIYGARNRAQHPFAKESRELLETLPNSRSHIVYSKPDSGDQPGVDYDSVGHVDTPLLDRLGVTRDADFYLCGPPSFLKQITEGLKIWGVDSPRIHRGGVWAGSADNARRCAVLPTSGSRSGRRTRRRTTGFIYTQRAHGSMGFPVLQFAGVRGSVRCSRPMGVPYRSLPYLRVRR